MRLRSRLLCAILAALCLSCLPLFAPPPFFAPVATAQTKQKKQESTASKTKLEAGAEQQEPAEESESEDLAPAAVKMDVSNDTPLITALYQATRETKERAILAKLEEAEGLIGDGDIHATDPQGRTALHWAVMGCSYSIKASVVSAYVEIADKLIARGVNINLEDDYQDTALDYLLYSPNYEMQTLLLEHGAASGFLAAFYHFFVENPPPQGAGIAGRMKASMGADLSPGQTISIRLETPVWSDKSRTGDPIEAVVRAPAYKNKQLVLAPGTKIDGTVLFAQKAPDKYSRPRLVLDFSNFVYSEEGKSPLYARVLAVDNARETVQNNEILGIIQPHASTKASLVLSAVGMANPIASYAIQGAKGVYGASLRREIYFPEGTDITIQVVRPSVLLQKVTWAGWTVAPVVPKLTTLVREAPLRTETTKKTPSDVTNIMFIGSQEQIASAFAKAGWGEAEDLGFRSSVKTIQAAARKTGYTNAPVSLLLLNDSPPDLVFQKGLDTINKRHHIRIWKQTTTYEGQGIWVAAATHDIGVASGGKGTKWYHRIDPRVDRERDRIRDDMMFSGVAKSYAFVDRPDAPRKTMNGTGDQIITDGKMLVLFMVPGN